MRLHGIAISLTVLAIGLAMLLSVSAMAADVLPICEQTPQADVCKDHNLSKGAGDSNNPLFGQSGVITKVVQILVVIVGILAVVTMILSGLKIITSGGNADSAASGRRGVIYAIIGLLMAFLAQAIVTFVLSKL